MSGAFFFAFMVFSAAVLIADLPEADPVLAAGTLFFALAFAFCVVVLAGVRRQRPVITDEGASYITLFGRARVLWSEVAAVESVSTLFAVPAGEADHSTRGSESAGPART